MLALNRAVLAVLGFCRRHLGLGTMTEKSSRAPVRLVACVVSGTNCIFTRVALLATGRFDGVIGALLRVDGLTNGPLVLALVKSHNTARAQLGTRAACFLAHVLKFARDGAVFLVAGTCEEVVFTEDAFVRI